MTALALFQLIVLLPVLERYGVFEFSKRQLSAADGSIGTGPVSDYCAVSLGGFLKRCLLQLLLSGASAGVGYWLACYPIDVAKTMLQTQRDPPKVCQRKWEENDLTRRFLLSPGAAIAVPACAGCHVSSDQV
jgi:hypothetical protein